MQIRLKLSTSQAFLFLALAAASVAYPANIGGLTELPERPPAPNFELPDIGGKLHTLSDLKGKVVLVNFWATWCPPCRAEMPSLERLWNQLKDEDFEILAVNIGESNEQIAHFYFSMRTPLTFTILADRNNQASQYWPIRGLPGTYVIDRKGRVTHVAHGARRWDTSEIVSTLKQVISADN